MAAQGSGKNSPEKEQRQKDALGDTGIGATQVNSTTSWRTVEHRQTRVPVTEGSGLHPPTLYTFWYRPGRLDTDLPVLDIRLTI